MEEELKRLKRRVEELERVVGQEGGLEASRCVGGWRW